VKRARGIPWWTCLLASVALAMPAVAFDVAVLMQQLAQAKHGEVRFEEKKFSSLLTTPLESAGTLRYAPPDRLEKRTEKPASERMVVEGDQLTITRGGRVRSLSLAQYPVIQAFIESIRGTLAGDRAALERFYRLRLEGEPGRWWLTLEPIAPDMRALVQSIRISGSKAQVREVEIFEVGGDRSVMTITE